MLSAPLAACIVAAVQAAPEVTGRAGRRPATGRNARSGGLAVSLALLAACSAPARPTPGDDTLANITDEDWAELERQSEFADRFEEHVAKRIALERAAGEEPRLSVLGLSGGGQNGAFGAGMLACWPRLAEATSEVVGRPRFDIVTGVSTGALQASAAFLDDPALDRELLHLYTSIDDESVYEKHSILEILSISGLTYYHGLEEHLREFIDDAVIDRVGAEYPQGRSLWVGTTNLDTGRFHTWNLTYVAWRASQGEPEFYELYRELVLASASIPMAVEPRYVHGYMHGDGGVLRNVFVPHMTGKLLLDESSADVRVEMFMILNGRLDVEAREQETHLFEIAGRALELLMTQNSYSSLLAIRDAFAMILVENPLVDRSRVKAHLAYIPSAFRERPEKGKEFDTAYMKKLADFGGSFVLESRWATQMPRNVLDTDAVPDELPFELPAAGKVESEP